MPSNENLSHKSQHKDIFNSIFHDIKFDEKLQSKENLNALELLRIFNN